MRASQQADRARRVTGEPNPPADRAERGFRVGLICIVAIAGAFRLVANHFLDLDHNGAWHVFIAKNLSREWRTPPHPPLFLLLLRACDAMSHSLLSYRAVPLLAALGSVILVALILRKLNVRDSVGLIGALTMACAQSATVLSLEVESYSLCVVLLLAAFYFYLDLVRPEAAPPTTSRLAFAGLASLAIATHYFTVPFLAVCGLAPAVLAAVSPAYRRTMARALPGRWRNDLYTLAVPAIVAGLVYVFVARVWLTAPLNHLLPFYFHRGAESLSSFLVRNLSGTVALFAPVSLPRARFNLPLLAGFIGLVSWGAVRAPAESPTPTDRRWPALFLLLLLAVGMTLGVIGRYPFGGSMRHQFLLFLFALLAGFVALDSFMRTLRAGPRIVVCALAVAAIGADVIANRRGYMVPPFEPFEAKRGIVTAHLAGAATVHLDQLNLIALMMERYRWDWRYAGHQPTDPAIEHYELTNGDRKMTVIAHRHWWIFDFANAALYSEFASSWPTDPHRCEVAFTVYRNIYKPPWKTLSPADRRQLDSKIGELAYAEGLRVSRVQLDDDSVYAELCRDSGPPVVSAIEPAATRAGVGFLVQPTGDSALSIRGSGFLPGASVVLDGRRLATTFGNRGWITAVVPAELFSKPARLHLWIANPDQTTSNEVMFEVLP